MAGNPPALARAPVGFLGHSLIRPKTPEFRPVLSYTRTDSYSGYRAEQCRNVRQVVANYGQTLTTVFAGRS